MAGLGSELFTLATSFDPAGAMRQADVDYQKYQVQQAGLAQQQREIAAEQGAPMGLGKMSQLAVPKTWTLETPDGMPTTAGDINRKLVDGKKNQTDGQKLMNQAKYATDPNEKRNLYDTGRRLFDEGGRLLKEGGEDSKKAVSGLFFGLGTAGSKDDWDTALKSYQDSGIPLPENFPKEYSPENKRKVIAIAKGKDPEIAKKIENENRAIEDQQIQREEAKRKKLKADAAAREDLDTPVKPGETVKTPEGKVVPKATGKSPIEVKIEDPTYGYYTGKKPPAFEQRIGRRVDEHGSVVSTDVKQVSKILKGGEKKLSGSTLANVKDTGLLSAPVVALSKNMTANDVLLYDAAMETLLKNMTLFQNPDYKPTDADVIIAQKGYKAKAGEPHYVQLYKLAKLRADFEAAAGSYFNSKNLNKDQAESLKEQLIKIRQAIPFTTDEAEAYFEEGGDKKYKTFKEFLDAKHGGGTSTKQTKPTESASPKTVTTQEEYNALPSGSIYIEDGKKYRKP